MIWFIIKAIVFNFIYSISKRNGEKYLASRHNMWNCLSVMNNAFIH